MNIRNYKDSDFEEISNWWKQAKEVGPTREMLPQASTFILENDGISYVCVTVYLLNSKQMAWVDNLIANPGMDRKDRKILVEVMQNYIEGWAHTKGYKSLFCMAHRPKLAMRYTDLGYRMTCEHMSTFVKEL